ncbi:MAG: peptide deformylase [Gemmatimonadota bacterium]|nr:MAG: peptide deformylase [Gemmatimonadota bacterium]
MYRIRVYGDPVLRKQAQPITEIDASLRTLVDQMFQTMWQAEGVGLAAPQIGRSIALTVIDPRPLQKDTEPLVILNPRIVEERGACGFEEGCLSVPEIKQDVIRSEFVVVEGMDLEGKTLRIETGDLLARILQHEIDHLNGTLFIDRLATVQRQMVQAQLDAIEKRQRVQTRIKANAKTRGQDGV